MTRGELAVQVGCHLETVRFYEHRGLMPNPPRSEGGHRQYTDVHERRLRFILRGRELGFTLQEIQRLLDLVDRKCVDCGAIKATALAHLGEVRRKITDLRRMERTLASTAARCRGGASPDCPIVDALAVGAGRARVADGAGSGSARRYRVST
jgi:MerR family mercuric resistance operon transcriptional regulator